MKTNKIVFWFFLSLTLFLFSAQANCAEKVAASTRTSFLSAVDNQVQLEEKRNDLLAQKLTALQNEKLPSEIDAIALQRVDMAIALANEGVEEARLTLSTGKQSVESTGNIIQNLQDLLRGHNFIVGLSSARQAELQNQLSEQQALLSSQQKRVKILQSTETLSQALLVSTQQYKQKMQEAYWTQLQEERQSALNQLAVGLQQQQQIWLSRLAELNEELAKSTTGEYWNNPRYAHIEGNIFQAQEESNLSQIELDLARFQNEVDDLSFMLEQSVSLTVLNTSQHQISTLIDRLKVEKNTLNDKINLIKNRAALITQNMQSDLIYQQEGMENLAVLNGFLTSYQKQSMTVDRLLQATLNYQTVVAKKLNLQLASRQGLPGFERVAWQQLGEKIAQIPLFTWQALRGSIKTLSNGLMHSLPWQWFFLAAELVFSVLVWIKLRRYFFAVISNIERREEHLFLSKALMIFLQILSRQLPTLIFLGFLIGTLVLLDISLGTFGIIIGLMTVGLVFSAVMHVSRALLLDTAEDKGGDDVQLYRRLRLVFSIGGFFTGLTILVHQLPIAYDVQDFFARLFMLFLLLISFLLLRIWFKLPLLLGEKFESTHFYLKKVINSLTMLSALTLFSNAILGLAGYVELAWNIAAYEGIFLLVLVGYLLVNAVVTELMRFLSGWMIQRVKNGWLWSEAILAPIHLLFKAAVFIAAFVVLFASYEWGLHSWVVAKIVTILYFNLFDFAESAISLFSIMKIIIVIATLFWVTRWTRELAYRWMFAHLKDAGLRNSLSIFSQYAMVVVGILIGLKVIGINLTALTFIVTGFVFGIGLGLRDLANNFISGILLLIERPARVGDYITVGEYEGEVTHIGMRSVTVNTEEHQELVVPNAYLFSQTFINWTHHDTIVRVLVILKVNRKDDPHHVKTVIEDVVKSIPEILEKPRFVVYWKRMDEELLEFQLEFYVDFRKVYSRSAIRTKLLFALWDRFKAEGIRSPETSYEVSLKGRLPENNHDLERSD